MFHDRRGDAAFGVGYPRDVLVVQSGTGQGRSWGEKQVVADAVRTGPDQPASCPERPDLHFHDLRHTGATLAAATGATLADLMARIGHSTPAMALRYQYAVEGRDQQIAAALSGFAQGKVIALHARSITG